MCNEHFVIHVKFNFVLCISQNWRWQKNCWNMYLKNVIYFLKFFFLFWESFPLITITGISSVELRQKMIKTNRGVTLVRSSACCQLFLVIFVSFSCLWLCNLQNKVIKVYNFLHHYQIFLICKHLQELQRWMQEDLFSRPLCCSLCHSISAFTLCFYKVLNDKTGEILYKANKNNQKIWLVIVELVTE